MIFFDRGCSCSGLVNEERFATDYRSLLRSIFNSKSPESSGGMPNRLSFTKNWSTFMFYEILQLCYIHPTNTDRHSHIHSHTEWKTVDFCQQEKKFGKFKRGKRIFLGFDFFARTNFRSKFWITFDLRFGSTKIKPNHFDLIQFNSIRSKRHTHTFSLSATKNFAYETLLMVFLFGSFQNRLSFKRQQPQHTKSNENGGEKHIHSNIHLID